jgi:hypothetical protein
MNQGTELWPAGVGKIERDFHETVAGVTVQLKQAESTMDIFAVALYVVVLGLGLLGMFASW